MLRSGLVLTGDGSFIAAVERGAGRNAAATDIDNEILTAFEAQYLHLDSTELVVLSACQTVIGEVVTGEGI
jgi:CHAT domain-containing protein